MRACTSIRQRKGVGAGFPEQDPDQAGRLLALDAA